MAEVCPNCGLPKEICVCSVLDKETESKIKVYTKKAKFNKFVTIVEGINPDEIENATKSLKKSLACGGTDKDNVIELQGEHVDDVKRVLVNLGYKEANIEVLHRK
ncbi:MAG: stress response translation initiation inhibitor YciH [Candidatus Marsarchaeota archaeon]|jgi:translation initiation factor 1|nr:stress response translation initiation inhibitor YciH [Candidatus Marsarchaeota archaeon]